jgi:hypothetical protein
MMKKLRTRLNSSSSTHSRPGPSGRDAPGANLPDRSSPARTDSATARDRWRAEAVSAAVNGPWGLK